MCILFGPPIIRSDFINPVVRWPSGFKTFSHTLHYEDNIYSWKCNDTNCTSKSISNKQSDNCYEFDIEWWSKQGVWEQGCEGGWREPHLHSHQCPHAHISPCSASTRQPCAGSPAAWAWGRGAARWGAAREGRSRAAPARPAAPPPRPASASTARPSNLRMRANIL